MTATKEQGEKATRADQQQLGRTFAISLVSGGYAAMTAGMTYFLIVIALPAAAVNPEVAAVIPRIVVVTAIVAVIGAVSLVWSGARRRSWFWLVAVVPGLLMVLLNARDIAYDVTHPTNMPAFLRTILVLAGGLAIIFGGIAAFLEVRRGRVSWTRFGRAGWVSIAVVGALMGATITSALAGSAAAGAEVSTAPTVTGMLTAEKTAFVETRLQMKDGEVLGLFLINKDDIAHSFDIDSLDIHVQMPPNSTRAVAIKPTEPGTLEVFCAVPGHEEAGMVGTIEVEA